MKRNIIRGAVLLATLAFASCSTQKLATSAKSSDDDVYYTKAKAGDQVDMPIAYQQDGNADGQSVYDDAGDGSDDDYYYYDSYASRINRFSYDSPFNYYDDYYYDYSSPYSNSGYGLDAYAYGGGGFGIGLGFGYGGYGYNPYGYYGYSSFGIGYGGGYPYWGIYSGYGYGGGYGGYGRYGNGSRPFRGSGAPAFAGRSVRGLGYNGKYPTSAYYPGRSVTNGIRRAGTTGYSGGNNNGRQMRPVVRDNPTYQPRVNSAPSGSSNSGGGNSGGGGARPGRP